jgi:hypothetical protein
MISSIHRSIVVNLESQVWRNLLSCFAHPETVNPHVLLKLGAPDEKWSVRIFPIKRPEIAVHPQVTDFLFTQTILLVYHVIPILCQNSTNPHTMAGWLMLVVYHFCFGCTPSGPWYRTCKRPGYFQPPRPRTWSDAVFQTMLLWWFTESSPQDWSCLNALPQFSVKSHDMLKMNQIKSHW